MRELMLIVNPFSGSGTAKTALFDVVDAFCKNGFAPTVYLTGGEATSRSLAAEYGSRYRLIVCIGGDGTLSDVAGGLMAIDKEVRPSVGYIPTGTANDVATTLALPRDPKKAVNVVIEGAPHPYDLGCVFGNYFTYIAAFGAFTEVSYTTPQNLKRTLGHAAYVFSGLSALPAIRPYHTIVEYDGGVIEGTFVFGGVCNSTSVAGLVKLKRETVDLADGMFEVILVRNPLTAADFLNILADVSNQNFNSDDVILLHTSSVKFTFDEDVAWTRDGEDGGKHKTVEVTICPRAIDIIL